MKITTPLTAPDDQKNSSFWLGKHIIGEEKLTPAKLSAYRRSITNFVHILTGKNNISVTYQTVGKSYTDGKHITISSDISKSCFDSVVGLALHESAHIVKSDFRLVQQLELHIPDDMYLLAESKNLPKHATARYVKKMFNWIEDRYIDAWVCNTAVGYRGYYESLYQRYFNSDKITEALLNRDLFTSRKLSSYSFRIINLTNPSSLLDALPGLEEIHKISDLANVLALTKTRDRFEIALKIANIVFTNIDPLEVVAPKKKEKTDGEGDPEKGGTPDPNGTPDDGADGDPDQVEENDEPVSEEDFKDEDSNTDEKETSPESDDKNDTQTVPAKEKEEKKKDEPKDKEEADENSDSSKEKESKDSKNKKSDKNDDSTDESAPTKSIAEIEAEEKELVEEIEKQENFVAGNVGKAELTEEEAEDLDLIDRVGMSLVDVSNIGFQRIKCVVVKKFTKELINSGLFPLKAGEIARKRNEEAIKKGILLGTALGRKLQVRGETNTLKFIRQASGKIERRLIHEIGFGNESLFERSFTEKFKSVELHISVDLSSSMNSSGKWIKTLTCLVAICKAASMIPNINVVVSTRSGALGDNKPYILIAYDSKVDKFIKIPTLFQFITPNGGTPEGLAFEAMIDMIPASNNNTDSYFVNLSDGEPCFAGGYMGEIAYKHTYQQVQKILQKNVKVLSYFIEDGAGDDKKVNVASMLIQLAKARIAGNTNLQLLSMSSNREAFLKMYGKNSNFINVTNISEIARTLNKKFLEK